MKKSGSSYLTLVIVGAAAIVGAYLVVTKLLPGISKTVDSHQTAEKMSLPSLVASVGACDPFVVDWDDGQSGLNLEVRLRDDNVLVPTTRAGYVIVLSRSPRPVTKSVVGELQGMLEENPLQSKTRPGFLYEGEEAVELPTDSCCGTHFIHFCMAFQGTIDQPVQLMERVYRVSFGDDNAEPRPESVSVHHDIIGI
jgi:hypothetical protein